MNTKSLPWATVAVLATLVGLYPVYYYVANTSNPGLLQSKSAELLASYFYRAFFYTHITFGGMALLIGWLQFSKKLRARNIDLHRSIGKTYMIAVLLGGLAGLVIALFATGGLVSTLGFGFLAIAWLYTDIQGYRTIRRLEVEAHRGWMIRNYALTFAAVTLRIYLPLATMVLHIGFVPAYRVIAWLCWVPNLVVAGVLVRGGGNKKPEGAPTGAGLRSGKV